MLEFYICSLAGITFLLGLTFWYTGCASGIQAVPSGIQAVPLPVL